MRRFKGFIAILYCLFAVLPLPAQDSLSPNVLPPGRFNQYILNNHPVAEKADLIEESGRYEVKKARGNFDPKLFSDWDAKNFKGTHYYEVSESGLKIPTWFGLDFKLYYQNNSGTYLNPENTDPGNGLYGIGVSVPIGEGLFTDERRTALNKAKVIKKVNSNRKDQLLIDLLSEAFKDYWEWTGRYYKRKIVIQTRRTARQRFENVKTSYRGGEKPAIDTTDALSQLQRWRVKQSAMQAKYQKQHQLLSTYLWNENQEPVSLKDTARPPDIFSLPLSVFKELRDQALQQDSIPANHPAIKRYRNKLEILSIENRWKKEQLKPELDLKYHALQDAGSSNVHPEEQLTQDMKWGISFQFPIFLRKEINSLRLNKVKTKTTKLDLQTKKQALQAKLSGLQAVLSNLYEQISRNRKNLENYERLVTAEEDRFNAGEGDLFRINYREMTYLKARLNQVDYITDFFKTYSEIMYRYQLYRQEPDID